MSNRLDPFIRLRGVRAGSMIEWDTPEHAHWVAFETIGPGRGELIVETLYSAVSPGTEVAVFQGRANTPGVFPTEPGYSLCGRIVEVGSGTGDYRKGQLIALQAGHRSFVRCRAADAFAVPDGVSARDASLVILGVIALNGVWAADVGPRDHVAVIGRGIVGQLVVQLTRCQEPQVVSSLARSARAACPPVEAFADHVLSETEQGWQRLEGLKPNVIIEASGSVDALKASIRAVQPEGCVVLLGSYRDVVHALDLDDLARRDIELIGAHTDGLPLSGGAHTTRAAGELFLDLIAKGRIRVGELIDDDIDPKSAGAFYRDLSRGKTRYRGVVFDWSKLGPKERYRRVSLLSRPI